MLENRKDISGGPRIRPHASSTFQYHPLLKAGSASRPLKALFFAVGPWSVEETDACFIVRDKNGQALAYVYFEEEPGRSARRHTRMTTTTLGTANQLPHPLG